MPASAIVGYAKKSGKSVAEVERYWEEAKKFADNAFKGKAHDSHYWAYVNGIVKNRCKIKESTSFKEFVELSFDAPQVDLTPAGPAQEAPTPMPDAVPGCAGPGNECENYTRFIASIFAARDKAHELHLAARTYSRHIALNELYDLLLDFADKMSETFQGKHGLMPLKIPASDQLFPQECPIEFIVSLTDWLETTGRTLIGSDSFIINLYEELIGDVYRVKYKLDNLA